MRRIDLHAHTTASDGSLTPTQLVRLAAETGLAALSVTDHDTIDGLAEAQAAATEVGIELVSGIELAVTYPTGRFHMLGYLFDPLNQALNDRLDLLKQNRARRNQRMLERIRAAGIDLTLEEVRRESGGGQVGRPHMALALVRKGIVTSAQEAFDRYLADGAAAHVPKDKITPEEGIDLIHGAGGLASIAHPHSLRLKDLELVEALTRMRGIGVDGIECYYSEYDSDRTQVFLAAANSVGLLPTGGSDFHGDSKPNVKLGIVGSGQAVNYEVLRALKAARDSRQLGG